jgi:hypothetical protein
MLGQSGELLCSVFDEGLLGTLLFLAAGISRVAHTAAGDPIWFRSRDVGRQSAPVHPPSSCF